MDYTRLGSSGLKVSRIALGCMSFGDQSQMPWALDDAAAEPIFHQAVESGITFWDTANIYGHGTSEEITGRVPVIHISGYQQGKAEWLDQIDSGRMSYDAIREESVAVEVKGETAVLTARALVTATIYGSHGTLPLKSVTRYARRDGTWKPVHSRATPY